MIKHARVIDQHKQPEIGCREWGGSYGWPYSGSFVLGSLGLITIQAKPNVGNEGPADIWLNQWNHKRGLNYYVAPGSGNLWGQAD
jgi:hypothetical protein